MRGRGTYSRGRCLPVVLAVLAGVVSIPVLEDPAAAHSAMFGRATENIQTVPLRTRGYLNDGCLVAAADCRAASGRYRPEATAQARAIRRLSATRGALISPRVQWEVSRDPDTDCAPEVVALTDTDVEPPTSTPPTTAAPGASTSSSTTAG